MDLSKILEHLRWELEQLNCAIRSLECIQQRSSPYRSGIEPDPESPQSRARSQKIRTVGIRKIANKTE